MLECDGCQSITLRRRHDFSESDGPEFTYYPPRASRQLPVWRGKLPSEIVDLLKEVYSALHADSRRLAMMGARTLIDMFALDLVGDVGNFPQKLDKLENKGVLSKKNRTVLEAALDVGNAASHRGHRPTSQHLEYVMDIVENMLQASVLEPMADELKAATPKRKKSKPETRKTDP